MFFTKKDKDAINKIFKEIYDILDGLDNRYTNIVERVDALEKKYNEDKRFLIETLKDIQGRNSNVPQQRLKKDGTPAKKRGRKPNQKYFNLQEVCEITTLGKSTIYRWRHEGKFPKPVKLGTKTVWKKDDVDKWMEEVVYEDNMVTK
jgi:prophage regulatory protein